MVGHVWKANGKTIILKTHWKDVMKKYLEMMNENIQSDC